MFADTEAFSGFSVSDIDEARKFYAETLGLRVTEEYGLLTLRLAGGRDTLIYPRADHTPANFTILNFRVDDIDAAVERIREAGGEVLSTAIHDSGGNAQCRDDQGLRFDLFRPRAGY